MNSERRICVLAEGRLDIFNAKTAAGLLRYCPNDVVAVIDSQSVGQDLVDLIGVGKGVPIVTRLRDALVYNPNMLAIGVAVPGGVIPAPWMATIREALAAGLDIANGLHTRLSENKELADLAASNNCRIWDVRKAPDHAAVGTAKAKTTRGRRILTVGTDCNLGKRVTALEITKELNGRGLNAQYVATGQTGAMIAGSGVVIDAVVSDFVSGAVEAAVLEKANADFIVVEGQGSILHPSYSAVTLGLMHGTLPDYLVVCHTPLRTAMRSTDNIPMPSLTKIIQLSEELIRHIYSAVRAIGVSLNCHGLRDEELAEVVRQAEKETGLPVIDPIRTGTKAIVDEIVAGG